MQNQEDDDADFGDDVYDDVLDESFEDDFDDGEYDDIDLDEEVGDEDFEDFDDGETEEWDTSEESVEESIGAQKKKSRFEMSTNAMAITGALVVGVGVLIYQVVTTKSDITVDNFVSALNMSGAADGPVFGEEEKNKIQLTTIESSDSEKEVKGFLHDPDILDSMEMELKDTPPMPSPISSEETQESNDPINVTVDAANENPAEIVPAKEIKKDDFAQIPRSPDGFGMPTGEIVAVPEENSQEDQETLPKAEDVLKEAMASRQEKAALLEKTETVATVEPVVPDTIISPTETNPTYEQTSAVKVEDPAVTEIKESAAPVNSFGGGSDIQQKLDMIVSRLDDMESQITQIQEMGSSKIESVSEDLKTLKKEMGTLGRSEKTAKVAAAPKKTAPAVKKPKKSPPKKVANVAWELRAAQPGKAWVSKKGQQDVRPVVVGDTLTNIGRITSISYSGGRWIVQGTSGRISQ